MNGSITSPETIFGEAIHIASAEERAAYLTSACGNDTALRRAVEQLVQNHFRAGSFLKEPPAAFAPTIAQSTRAEHALAQIGPYKLLQQIGEGGMGVVYMAEQTHPVQRKAALKLIKPGLDSRQVIARFEAERQALALMDHPNIAKVLDAGTTDAGQPYFVMELVHGTQITKYCDERRLSPRERLELFIPVCQAVQHAHQKGIIHRDIKPSNVLVTLYDGKPVPKVIDFGVAKATGPKLTERTMFTEFGSIVGTLEYMSPEQAERDQNDVDTRGDIYSLGVLLYELLTGSTPLDKKRLKSAAILELLRIIKEEEPEKPSSRLSTTDELPSIAANRNLEPKKLSGLVRGELDWIVMKALEKDRSRRYETANGFALDVQRYLADEPVAACPPSAVYRFRKFARRNRGPVVAGTLVLITLLVGIAGTTLGLLQARAERDRVLAAKEQERLALLAAEENFQTARDAVDQMYTRAAEEMRDKPQVEQIRRELLEEAARFYQGFLKKKSEDPAVRYEAALSHRRLGEIYGYLGEGKSSLEHYRQAVAMLADLSPSFANDARYRDELARSHFHFGQTLLLLAQIDEGTAGVQKAMELLEALTAEFPNSPSYLEDLARANVVLGRTLNLNYEQKAEQYVHRGQELLARLKQKFPGHQISNGLQADFNALVEWRYRSLPHDPATLRGLERECRDQLAAAEVEALKSPDVPQHHMNVAEWLGRWGNVLAGLDEMEQAEPVCRRKLDIHKRLAIQHPDVPAHRKDVAWTEFALGEVLYETDRPDEAFDHFQTAIRGMSRLAAEYPEYLRYYNHLGGMLHECPLPELRDPSRALEIALRVKQLKEVGWEDVVVCQIDAEQYQQALETCEKASQAGEQSAHYPYATAVAHWHLGRKQDARNLLQQTVLRSQTEPSEYWWGSDFRRRIREAVNLMGLEIEGLRSSDPETVLRNGIALYQKLAAEQPGDASPVQELAGRYRELAQLLNHSGRFEAGEQCLADAAAAYAQLTRDHSTVPLYRELEARTHHDLGLLQQQRGRNQDAERNYRQAIAVWTTLAEDVPTNPGYRVSAVNSMTYQLTPILAAANRFAEAEQTMRQVIAAWEKLIEEFPDNAVFRRALGDAYGVLGDQSVKQQRFDEAERICSSALERWPDTNTLLAWRARVYVAMNQPDKALADISKAIELVPDDGAVPWWHGDRANVYRALNQPDKQLAELSQTIESWPQFWDARMWRGWYFSERQQWDLALADFSKAVELNPNSWIPWRHRGVIYANLRQWEQSVADLSRALELSPLDVWIWRDRARAYSALHQWDRAIADYAKAIEIDAGITEVQLEKISLHEQQGQWDRAFEAYTKLIARHPGQLGAVLERVRPKEQPEDEPRVRRSLAWFDEQIEKSPENAFLRAGRGRACAALQQAERALVDFEKAIELAPDQPEAPSWSFDRSVVYGKLQQPDQALAELSQAVDRWPNLREPWVWRGNFHNGRREWREAIADYSRALDLNPESWSVWQVRGLCFSNLLQWDRALADYDKTIELNPQTALAHNNLAWLLATCPDAKLRDPQRAVQSALKSIELAPAEGTYWNTVGVAHYRAGNLPAAVEALAKSNELLQQNQLSYNGFFLAMIRWRLDQQDEARAWFDKSVVWMDANAKGDDELIRFRAEAAELLGIAATIEKPVSALEPVNHTP